MPYFEEAVSIAQQIESPFDVISARGHVAEVIRLLGNVSESVIINEQLMVFAREHIEPVFYALPILLLAKSLNDSGEQNRALLLLKEQIHIFQQKGIRNPEWYVGFLDALACVYGGQGDSLHAAKIFGKTDAIMDALKHRRAHTGDRRWLHNDWEYAPYIAKARTALGDAAYNAAYAEGRAMPLEQAIAYALAV